MTRAAGASYEVYESKFELTIVMLCSMAGTLMQALDSTIANVALPNMQGDLAASRDQVTWVLTSYIVASAIMTAPVGWLASRFGRKNLAVVCIGGFTVCSMLCGAAQNLDQMILFRLLQGAFGAALSPLSQSIMIDLYPPEKRGNVMAIWGMGVMVGPILGPTLGGYLTDVYNWRWVFYVNVPFGIAAVAGIAIFLRDTHRDSSLKFDWTGFAALGVGLGALQLMLDRGTTKDWFSSGEIIIEAILAGVGFYLFAVHMLMTEEGFIPKAMFKDKNYVFSLLLMFVIGMMMLATTALLPPYLQDLGGYTVTDTGLMLAPRGIGTMLAMVFAGRMAMKWDPRYLMAGGTLLILWSMWEMTKWTPGINPWQLVSVTFVQGIGMALVFIPMNLVAFATLPQNFRTDGSALINLVRNVGSAIGISLTTTLLADKMQLFHAQMSEWITPFNRALGINAAGAFFNPRLPSGIQSANAMVNYNAAVAAYANDFMFILFTCIPALIVVLLMKRPPVLPPSQKPQLEVME